jgi:MFS family permease
MKHQLWQTFRLLYRYPAFRRLWVGRSISLFGDALPLIALLWGASLLPMAFTDQLWLACGLLLLGGLMWGPYTPMETTLLQRNVPKEQLGRVFGARSTLLIGGSPLGLAVGGILLAFAPATSVIAFSALACILVGLVGLLSPAFRGMTFPPAASNEQQAKQPIMYQTGEQK